MDIDLLRIRKFLNGIKKPPDIPPEGESSNKRPCEESEKGSELSVLEECLRNNANCRSLMATTENHLRALLDECTKELKAVRENIATVQSGKTYERKYHKVHTVCSTPYFKDSSNFPAPPNEDVALRKSCGFPDLCSLPKSVPWTDEQKKILLQNIRDSEIERWTKIARKAGTEQFCEFDKKTLAELIGSRKDEYDWLKISVMDFKSSRSPFECRAAWFNYLHPAINKTQWSEEEDRSLIQISEKYNHQDWDRIAEELNTNRSAYQCMGHFTCRLKDFTNRPWTEEENECILQCVAKYSLGSYIPWAKVALQLDGRSQNAIARHWEYINPDAKKGRYSLEEDIMITVGLRSFGTDYSKIAEFLPNRTNVQIRARVKILESHQSGLFPWSPEEDKLLCRLVKKYGFGNWSKISTHFFNRPGSLCRSRYKSILTWKEKHGPDSMPLVSKVIPNYNGTLDDLWKRAEKVVREKGIVSTADIIPDARLVHELSKVLLHKQKPGRPPGAKSPEVIDREFYRLFCSCYIQKGGRGKNLVSQELLPYMVKDTIMTLIIVNAKLVLPEDPKTIENDYRLPDVDKIFLKFLIYQKDLVKKIYESMERIRKVSKGNILYLCPPNYATLVGLRTLLLRRRSLKEQAKGDTLIPYVSSSGVKVTSAQYKNSCKQWNNRLQFLFTWAAFASKKYPSEACPISPETPLKFQSYGFKKVLKQEKIRKKRKPKKIEKPPELRRAYNKTGKYKISGDPNGAIRRSSRLSRGAEEETEN